ncbi:MAG: pyridoxamine 5'-phosphate oxidase family protein [Candidatus Saccharimonadales bacterium]
MHAKLKIAKKTGMSERQGRVFDFLNRTRVGVLSTVDTKSNPHGSVVYFSIDKNCLLFFLTKTDTQKYHNIMANQNVMLVAFDPVTQTVAQVIGKAQEITDGYSINRIAASVFMTSIKTSDGGIPPIAKIKPGEYVGFKIQPSQIRMASYAHKANGPSEGFFDSIESFEWEN